VIVLDTNVLSELMRSSPDANVVAWLSTHAKVIAIPAIAIGELRYGVARLRDGRRKHSLDAALNELVTRYAGSLLAYDVQAANACGAFLASAEAAGRPMSLADAQIAGIAKVAQARLATRNISDFEVTRLGLINPWES
jgi:predicted nucleic acid-binding protein